jgi:tetratricopeptide (TPR) repeat protein
MHLPRVAVVLAAMALCPASDRAVGANAASAALRAKGSSQIYNLDRDSAMATFREAIAADPADAAAYRGLATTIWLSITFRRGNMTVDDYLGGASRPGGAQASTPPPPETAAAFRDAVEKAIALARARIAANRRDADAHYELGAAVGLRASYTATVDGSVMGAFRAAREAFNEHEEVLSLDPKRKDAGLIVGTYRYIVSALALPVRVMAYIVGFGGDKERGLRMIEEAAAYHGDNEEDARFALVLLYNREKRWDDALRELAELRTRYPRNRLAWLEAGSTGRRRAIPRRGHGAIRVGQSPADVRRGCALDVQARRRAGRARPRRRGGGSQSRDRRRRAQLGARPRASGAREAGAQSRRARPRERTPADCRQTL